MDVLSDVLREMRLTGAVYFDVHAGAPWIATTPGSASICARVMPEFEHVDRVPHHDGWQTRGRRSSTSRRPLFTSRPATL